MSVLREVIITLRRLAPLLLSHHPECSFFSEDTYGLFGKRICLGCSVTYPTALLTALVFLVSGIYKSFPEPLFHQSLLFFLSLIFGTPQIVKYFRFGGMKGFRIMVKFLLGLSIGGMVVWSLTLPVNIMFRALVMISIIMFIMFAGTSRILYIRRICSGCIYHGDWDICYGFRGINLYQSFKHVRGKRALTRLIFDSKLRKNISPPPESFWGYSGPEPLLNDDCRWLYHDKGYDIPWLPRTSLEVERLEDVPCR